MRKFKILRKVITETKGNINLTKTKRTVTDEKAIQEVNTILAEILSDLEVDAV